MNTIIFIVLGLAVVTGTVELAAYVWKNFNNNE
jgi:hypothetical protein